MSLFVKIYFDDGSEPYVSHFTTKSGRTKEVNKWRNRYILTFVTEKDDGIYYMGFRSVPLNMGRKTLHITVHGDDTKMEGLRSISTSCKINPLCQKRAQISGSVCEKCYAQTYLEMRKGLRDWTEWNYRLLNSGILDKEDLPIITDDIFRLESFGDVGSHNAVINFINLCNRNPHTWFTAWTKNAELYDEVFKAGYKKPRNLIIIISSFMINVVADVSKYWWADKVFTVFESEAKARELGFEINCGNQADIKAGLKRKCRRCMKCYGSGARKSSRYINELLK